jgi:hypothetical protein
VPGTGVGTGAPEWTRIDISTAVQLVEATVDGILRGLTESIVARTTNLTVHYVGAATHVLGAADVLLSHERQACS